MFHKRKAFLSILSAFLLLTIGSSPAFGESSRSVRAQAVKKQAKSKNPFAALSIFKKNMNARSVVEVVDVTEESDLLFKSLQPRRKRARLRVEAPKKAHEELKAERVEPSVDTTLIKKHVSSLRYVSDKPEDTEILAPEKTPLTRINSDAPGCFKAMVAARRAGDVVLAKKYAAQCIRYQQQFIFDARDYASLMAEALVTQGVISEEEWDGVSQMMDYQLAKTRLEVGALLKPTHDVAMQRIEPDPKNQIEIFYFFTLNCSWCRYMSADAERLWRVAKSDPRIKMTGVLINTVKDDWLKEYRDYTGMTMPVRYDQALAKHFNIKFVPSLVILAPNSNKAYLKTGQQGFDRMYEFARTVQGLPATVTAQFKQLVEEPIGEAEKKHRKERGLGVYVAKTSAQQNVNIVQPKRRLPPEELVGRF